MTISYISTPNKRQAVSQTFNPVNYEGVAAYGDPLASYTTLLLRNNGTSTATNNTFTDSSTNNFTITRNGNTTQGTFTPYGSNWSNYFDGSGDYLNAGSSISLSGDFTVEGWVYRTSSSGNGNYLLGLGNDYNSTGATFFIDPSTGYLRIYTGQAHLLSGTTGVVPLNSWNHVAFVRSSNTLKAYLNGVQVDTASWSASLSGTAYINAELNGNPTATVYVGSAGYYSDVRIGTTAVYTTAFTPSTTPLTTITGTQLLTCQSNRFIDNSTNNFTITRNGDVSVQRFSPFSPTTAYSTSVIGGSGYFDGSGDYLTAAANTAFVFGSGDFTVETWIYPTLWPTDAFVVSNLSNGDTSWSIEIYGGNIRFTGWATVWLSATQPLTNSWHHVAVSRSGTTLSMFVDGVRVATTTNSVNFSANNTLVVGDYIPAGGANFNGYISNVRLVKGTAVYSPSSSTLTVPTAPLTAVANTSVLIPFNNAGIYDAAMSINLETVGDTKVSTSTVKYNTGSVYFDGTGDYLYSSSNQAFNFNTGDFTVEFWINASASGSYTQTIGTLVSGTEAGTWRIGNRYNSTNAVYFARGNGSGFDEFYTSVNVNDGAWHHVAVTRLSGTVYIYIDGLQRASSSISGTCSSSNPLYIGYNGRDSAYMTGYLDDVRITKGVARYTTDFIVPSNKLNFVGPLKTYTTDTVDLGGTELAVSKYNALLLQGDGTNGTQNNTFLDSSANNYSITRNGNSTQGTFTPYGGNWSNYFDGSGDYLSFSGGTPNTLGTNSSTIEFWMYATANDGYRRIITSNNGGFATGDFVIRFNNGGFWAGDVSSLISLSYVPNTNQWYHVAWVGVGGTSQTLYLNGVAVGTAGSYNLTNPLLYIGGYYTVTGEYFTGYLSNVRVVKGTAVYSSNFTPPTAPLTAIANTSLLTCQSNRFIDNSTNNLTITRNGDASTHHFNPFSTTTYSSSTHGGSGYFDGTGDYLTTTATSAFNITGDFTLETWMYPTAAANNVFFTVGTPRVNFNYGMSVNSDYTVTWMSNPANNWNISDLYTTTATVQPKAWNHIAAVKSGSNFYIFINGAVAYSTSSFAQPTAASGTIYMATYYANTNNDGSFVNGFLTDLRLVKGTAVYTSAFTPPTAPLTAITNTSILLSFTNPGIVDNIMMNDFETVGSAQISTTTKKYGTGSMYFDGTSSSLTLSSNLQNFQFGAGDFTVECWVNKSGNGTNAYDSVVGLGATGNATQGWYLEVSTSRGIFFIINNTSVSYGTWTNDSLWHHIAVSRKNGYVYIFKDGVLMTSGSLSTTVPTTASVARIGNYYNGTTNYYYSGYIDDLRITKGYARYTRNFTPPTAALPTT